jgi:hypothetical protein
MDSGRKNHALTAAQRPMAMGGFGGNHGPGGRSGGIAAPSQMQLAIAYANIPLPELRRRGIPELIQFIEANRSMLPVASTSRMHVHALPATPAGQRILRPASAWRLSAKAQAGDAPPSPAQRGKRKSPDMHGGEREDVRTKRARVRYPAEVRWPFYCVRCPFHCRFLFRFLLAFAFGGKG